MWRERGSLWTTKLEKRKGGCPSRIKKSALHPAKRQRDGVLGKTFEDLCETGKGTACSKNQCTHSIVEN